LRSKIAIALLIVVCLLPATGVSIAAKPASVTLTVLMQDFATANSRKVMLEKLVPEFEKAHPGVKVEVSWIPWSGYQSVYLARHAGGVAADVLSIGAAGLGEFAANGLIRSIDKYVRSWPGLRDMVPPAVEDGKVGEEFYSVAYMLDQRTFAYNKRAFEESGLDSAKPPRTWEEMLRAAKQLVRVDGDGKMTRKGFDVRNNYHGALPFVYQADGGYISTDGKQVLIDSENTIEAFEFLHSLIYEHRVATMTSGGNIMTPTAAMLNDSTWFMGRDKEGVIGVATPLKYRKQTAQVHIGKYAISSQSKHPDLAWEWIVFAMEPENLEALAQDSGVLVPRISAYQLGLYRSDPRWNTWLQAAMMGTILPGGNVPAANTIAGEFGGVIIDILSNKVPARTRLNEFADKIKKVYLNPTP